MTNESKRHERDLADVGERLSRRASVYHRLLDEVLRKQRYIFGEMHEAGLTCVYCRTVWHPARDEPEVHRADCLITRIERALDGDDDALREMMRELGG